MMDDSQSGEFDRQLTLVDQCSICLDFLHELKILPSCTHAYCADCIARLFNHGGGFRYAIANCPQCRTPLDIRPDEISDLPTNAYFESIIESDDAMTDWPKRPPQTDRVLCSWCAANEDDARDTSAAYACKLCCQYLCNDCRAMHAVASTSRHHSVEDLQKLVDAKSTDSSGNNIGILRKQLRSFHSVNEVLKKSTDEARRQIEYKYATLRRKIAASREELLRDLDRAFQSANQTIKVHPLILDCFIQFCSIEHSANIDERIRTLLDSIDSTGACRLPIVLPREYFTITVNLTDVTSCCSNVNMIGTVATGCTAAGSNARKVATECERASRLAGQLATLDADFRDAKSSLLQTQETLHCVQQQLSTSRRDYEELGLKSESDRQEMGDKNKAIELAVNNLEEEISNLREEIGRNHKEITHAEERIRQKDEEIQRLTQQAKVPPTRVPLVFLDPPTSPVYEVASLDDTIVLVHMNSPLIELYANATPFKMLRRVTVEHLVAATHVASCRVNRCIYISDCAQKAVYRIDADMCNTAFGFATRWWVDDSPYGLSVTPPLDCHVLVTCSDVGKVRRFTSDGTPVDVVTLGAGITNVKRAVLLPTEQLLICRDPGPMNKPQVCMLTADGKQVTATFDDIEWPTSMAVDDDLIYVADLKRNSVVVKHIRSLESPNETTVEMETIGRRIDTSASPHSICLDDERSSLYVADSSGRVAVLQIR